MQNIMIFAADTLRFSKRNNLYPMKKSVNPFMKLIAISIRNQPNTMPCSLSSRKLVPRLGMKPYNIRAPVRVNWVTA